MGSYRIMGASQLKVDVHMAGGVEVNWKVGTGIESIIISNQQ